MAAAEAPNAEQILNLNVFSLLTKETRSSIQGLRTVLEIRRRLPVPFDVYSATLRAVKYWAMQRRVYGNNYGYPAGVSLAIMVARACQVYPAHHPSVLLRFFFRFYLQWLAKRHAVSPLFITEVLKPEYSPKVMGMWDTWDPNRESSKEELLPVLNPAYPHNNTCYNVGRSGLEAFYRELTRAHKLLSEPNGRPVFSEWTDLWAPYILGSDYPSFLIIEMKPPHVISTVECVERLEGAGVASEEEEEVVGEGEGQGKSSSAGADGKEQVAASTSGSWESWVLYIESKLKILLYSLESCEGLEVRMWPKRLLISDTSYGWAIGLRGRDGATVHVMPGTNLFSQVAASVEDFQFAAGEYGLRGPYGFVRHPATMPFPSLFVVSASDSRCPVELTHSISHRDNKRQRDEEDTLKREN